MLTRLIARSDVVSESSTEYNAADEYEYRDAGAKRGQVQLLTMETLLDVAKVPGTVEFLVAQAFPPPITLGVQLVSRDEWHIRRESPNKSRTGTYSGGYQ